MNSSVLSGFHCNVIKTLFLSIFLRIIYSDEERYSKKLHIRHTNIYTQMNRFHVVLLVNMMRVIFFSGGGYRIIIKCYNTQM